MKINRKKGFTLIELMVVIAIISLLSSVVYSGVSSAKAKSRDVKALSDFRAVSQALTLYYDKYKRYPNHDTAELVSTNPWRDNFTDMAQHLVSEGLLSSVPTPPSNLTYYQYYNYRSGNVIGGIIVTTLETIDSSTVPAYSSCRPFTNNWCSNTISSKYYCLCHPYY